MIAHAPFAFETACGGARLYAYSYYPAGRAETD